MPVLFNPANYYMHSAFLLVVLAGETKEGVSVRGRLTWLVLLLMCTASYFTSLVPDVGTHFAADTGVMLTAFGLLMVLHLAPEALFVVPTALAPVSGPPVIVAEESEPEDELEGEQPAAGEGAQAPAEVEGQRSADGTAGALDEDAGGRPQHHG